MLLKIPHVLDAAALHRAVSEALGLGALAALQGVPVGRFAEEALGVGLLLEGRPQGIEGERPRGRAHSAGTRWPRR